jgi:phosphatidylglycerophosphate synthase
MTTSLPPQPGLPSQSAPIAAAVTPDSPFALIVAQLASAQKSNRGAPGYARWINRRLGRYAAAAAYKRGFTPNQVTGVSAVLTFTGVALIALLPAKFWAGLIIALLLMAGFALDAADGQLARLRGGGSPAGEWLDHVVDCIKCSSLHMAILITWFRHFGFEHASWLLIPIGFGVQYTVFFFSIMLTEQLRRASTGTVSSTKPKTDEAAPVLRSIIVLPADYGVLCVMFLLLGAHTAFAWVYTLLFAANVVFTIGAFPKWYREISSIGKPVTA